HGAWAQAAGPAGGRERLDARLLVIGDDRHRRAFLGLPLRRLLQQRDLAIDTQHFRHFLGEFGIAAFEIVTHLVRLDLVRGQYLAQRSLSELGQARMARRWALFSHMPRGAAGAKRAWTE